jgi:hypothetical protein
MDSIYMLYLTGFTRLRLVSYAMPRRAGLSGFILGSYFSILLIPSENGLTMPLSFFLIRLAAFQANGGAYMKLRQNSTVFLMIKPAALAAGRNSEPQNFEYRTAEFRRVESLYSVFFKIDRIYYFDIRHSLFDIRYSLLQSFFFDQTGHLSGQQPEAGLTPDTRNLTPDVKPSVT